MGRGGERRRASLAIAACLLLSACAGTGYRLGDEPHAFPDQYKPEMLAALHAYLKDPTGIHDASISEPMLKSVPAGTRYIVCLRFTTKPGNGSFSGDKPIAAIFKAGRFEDFLDPQQSREPCAGAAYAPFPELETLQR